MFRNYTKCILLAFGKRSRYSRSYVIGRTFNYPKSKCTLTNTTQEQISNHDGELKDQSLKDELLKGELSKDVFTSFRSALPQEILPKMNSSGFASIKHQKTIDLIEKSANNISLGKRSNPKGDSELQKKLYNDFVNFSTHYDNDSRIQIGGLMDLYEIDSYELLYAMYKFNTPVGMGKRSNPSDFINYMDNLDKATTFNLEDSKIILKERNYYVDYLLGKSIKNNFRRKKGLGQEIKIDAYDHADQGKFYGSVIWLMASKLSKSTND